MNWKITNEKKIEIIEGFLSWLSKEDREELKDKEEFKTLLNLYSQLKTDGSK